MIGPGAKKMGGGGRKPGMPSAGKGIGGGPPMMGKPPPPKPPMGVGMGAGPPKPPGMGPGMPPPMPGGSAPGGPPPPPGAGIGGGAGFAAGGPAAPIDKIEPSTSAVATSEGYAKGGAVGGDTKPRHARSGKAS